jgi:hypothetical protein
MVGQVLAGSREWERFLCFKEFLKTRSNLREGAVLTTNKLANGEGLGWGVTAHLQLKRGRESEFNLKHVHTKSYVYGVLIFFSS